MRMFLKKYDRETKAAAFLILLFALSLIPIFWLGIYDYPAADDYGYSAGTYAAWTETQSVFQAIGGACATVADRWQNWQGTFSTMFLMAMQPGVWRLYALVPFLMIGMLSASTLFFLHTVMIKVIRVRRAVFLCVSMLYLLFATQCMIDKVQGFFWYNGAAHYMLPHCAALFLCGLCILLLTEEKKKAGRMVLVCLLAFFIGGSNYITALITAVLFVTLLIFLPVAGQKRKAARILLPFLFFAAAFLLNTLAPGNAVRQEEILVRPGVVKSILLSFYYCTEYLLHTWFQWSNLLFALALVPFLWETVKAVGNRFSYPAPLLVAFYSYCILSAMFTPSLFAEGEPGGGRIFNIIFLDAQLFLIANLFYDMGWIRRKWESARGGSEEKAEYGVSCLERKETLQYLAGLLFFTVMTAAMYAKADPDCFTSTSAVRSLITGEAAAYGEETKERDRLVQEADTAEIVIPRLRTHPYLLFLSDIEEDPGDWKNKSMARYYQKDAVSGRNE
ncbi:MAG: DUF6056 family protein [Bacteroidales bacterium]|nr:DUF6056 family protein [Bacteroidales bacterium]MCM1416522.1 DUF6056 family protein [bacterium]MCM1424500.1 DUF6056 family protein [bacterium]